MKINILEERIENMEATKLSSIIELIINAVRDYPIYGLEHTDLYFEEIKKLLGSENINATLIEDYIHNNQNKGDENHIWKITSLNSLLEAISLMDLYEISFEEVFHKIKEIL